MLKTVEASQAVGGGPGLMCDEFATLYHHILY